MFYVSLVVHGNQVFLYRQLLFAFQGVLDPPTTEALDGGIRNHVLGERGLKKHI
jgi:hypothetical protein